MPIDEATQTLIEELQLTDDQAVDFRADPRAWLREHLHEFTDIPFIFDDAHNADDG
jgi:hypothetical protein